MAAATTTVSPHHSRARAYKGPAPHPPDTGPPLSSSRIQTSFPCIGGRYLSQMQTVKAVKCELDTDECLSLGDMLSAFQTAINEEQAWALCHQTVKLFLSNFRAQDQSRLLRHQANASQHQTTTQQQPQSNQLATPHSEVFVISEPAHLFVHRDGDIHLKSLNPFNTQGKTH